MCAPVGFEALCTRHSWNVLGDILADQGLHALRFDYPGEGDALDRAGGETIVDAAALSIREAADWLTQNAGLTHLSVIGLRLGAPLAQRALDGRELHKAVWLAPAFRGRTYLREQKVTAQVMGELRPGQEAGPGEINICGFLTTAADAEAIATLSLERTGEQGTLLMLEPGRQAPAGYQGVETRPFEGYSTMMMSPTDSATPFETFFSIARWLAEDSTTSPAPTPETPAESVLTGDDFRETIIRFGETSELAGVLCEPLTPAGGPCIHLLNAGANYHIGWARMSVDHARDLARSGVSSLRYDFAGVGDSAWYPQGPRPLIYSDVHARNSDAAIAAMEARGYHSHILAGLCAGAYVAFHTAARHEQVTGALVANGIRLIWRDDDTLEGISGAMIQSSATYKAKLRSGAEWRRLLTGGVSLSRLVTIGSYVARKIALRVTGLAGIEPKPDTDALAARKLLEKAAAKGTAMIFMHAEHDQSRDETERRFGPNAVFARRHPGVSIVDAPGADHELTPVSARRQFLGHLLSLARNKKPGASAGP